MLARNVFGANKVKKAVQERWNLLRKKFSKKMSEEGKASEISVEELTERNH
ncbi:unnamed protein product [Pocillopora meandrina]|uniref:MADF domain-containing protein n=1 Tax=Pocillopora meandrina TaxID=46732 RepID=A0AAU9XBE7_9CNID|nr:unnamed protein product [Pocillopora meandrina]